MKLSPLIYTSGLVFSVWLGCDAYLEATAAREKAETIRVQYYTLSKWFEADKARTEAIKEHIALESQRTTAEANIKRVVIAEMKKCNRKVCK